MFSATSKRTTSKYPNTLGLLRLKDTTDPTLRKKNTQKEISGAAHRLQQRDASSSRTTIVPQTVQSEED